MKQLTALLDDIGGKDEIMLVSGYRSKEEQETIYKQSLMDNGEAYTVSYVALPGCSEHQTGLAIDVGIKQGELDFIAPAFPDTGISGEFKAQAAKFGFIQRYEQGKEQVTGISCEPWHCRYVGYPHSFIMNSNKLCLEEYMLLIQQHSLESGTLLFEDEENHYELYYVNAAEQGDTSISVLACDSYSWSGDNQSGFILTAVSSKEAGATRA